MKDHTLDVRILVLMLLALELGTSACGAQNLALTHVKTGPEQSMDVTIPYDADQSQSSLKLDFIAGDLTLTPGGSDAVVTGTARYNADEFVPTITADGTSYMVSQDKDGKKAVPSNKDEIVNAWNLSLTDQPLDLNINAGVYNGKFELGGLSLTSLKIDEAGSELECNFSEPNKVKMSVFDVVTGGSKMSMNGLANANFDKMTFVAGAGDYTLRFNGQLQHDVNVSTESGAGVVTLIIPNGVNALVNYNGGLSAVEASDGWTQQENTYTHAGSGPTITINVQMGVGTLNLRSE